MAQLKVFVTETRNTFLPQKALDALRAAGGGVGTRDQGTVFVVAPKKATAVELLKAAHVSTSFGTVRLNDRNAMVEALLAADQLSEGMVVAEPLSGDQLVRWSPLDEDWHFLGKVDSRTKTFTSQALVESLEHAVERVNATVHAVTDEQEAALELVLQAARDQLDTLRTYLRS